MLGRGKQNVYGSVVEELKRLIEAGVYKAGEKLPSVRTLAIERGINPNTVQRAYLSLEEEGLVTVYPKKGAFVCDRTREERSGEELVAMMRALKQSGVKREALERALDKAFEGERND